MSYKIFSLALLFIAGSAAVASAASGTDTKLKDAALKMVPESKVLKQDGLEFDLLTANETVMEVELNHDGSIDEVSGDAAAGGDVFIPGGGLMTLADAVAALKKAAKTPTGEWSFEKSFLDGWVYEFEGSENGKRMEYAINAKDGKPVKDRRDLR